LLCAFAEEPLRAQQPQPDSSRTEALRVFLDCRGGNLGCSLDYFVVELPFANWTRDRLFADVHLLVTTLTTGSGGTEWTLAVIGRERFAGRVDTLRTTTIPNASEDDVRRALKSVFLRALYPFAIQTPLASRFAVSYNAPPGETKSPTTVRDPWNFWILETDLNMFLNGEQQQKFTEAFGSIEARRVTEGSKIVVGAEMEYRGSSYTLKNDDGTSETFSNIIRNDGVRARVVRSLSPRLSVGGVASFRRSDFLNLQHAIRGGPVVEYNLYPWSQATQKQLTASYAVALNNLAYQKVSIFGLMQETRPSHLLTLATNLRQKWGSVNVSGRAAQYLHDLSKTELTLQGGMRLQLVKGLSLTLDGRVSRVRDQLYLPGSDLTNEQILVRQRALATNYSYFTYVGVNYTFGSIYNTIVNPRMDSFRLLGGF